MGVVRDMARGCGMGRNLYLCSGVFNNVPFIQNAIVPVDRSKGLIVKITKCNQSMQNIIIVPEKIYVISDDIIRYYH